MSLIEKMRHVRFFSIKTLFHLCGVLLVRFLPTWAENEHSPTPINTNLFFKPVDETGDVCGANIAAYDLTAINEHVCKHFALISRIIRDLKGVSR